MDHFPLALETLIGAEGGYVDHEDDSGGQTKAGITIGTARKHGYTGAMSDLPWPVIRTIYRTDYWEGPHIDEIAPVYPDVAYEVFEAGVLSGSARPVSWLQRYLNLNNDRENWYPDIETDGLIGPQTISALRSYSRRRGAEGEDVALIGLNSFQGTFLMELAERREKDESFVYGWLRVRAAVRRPLTSPALRMDTEYHRMLCAELRL